MIKLRRDGKKLFLGDVIAAEVWCIKASEVHPGQEWMIGRWSAKTYPAITYSESTGHMLFLADRLPRLVSTEEAAWIWLLNTIGKQCTWAAA